MRLLQSRLTGPNLKRVVDVFGGRIQDARILWAANTALVMAEDYSWRSNTHLLVMTVFVFTDDETCLVRYVTGSGRAGLLGLDLGSEASRSNRMVSALLEVCSAEGWTVTAE